jgi:DNA-binding beta-propeller fold protein YncE
MLKMIIDELSDQKKNAAPGASAEPSPSGTILPSVAPAPFPPLYSPGDYPSTPVCGGSTAPDALQVNHRQGTVTRYNPCSDAARTQIAVGSNPLQVGVTPDGSQALVSGFDGTLTVVDLATNETTILRTDNFNPSGVAISPDGSYAHVASFNASRPVVMKVDMNKQVTDMLTMPIQYPQSVVFTSDGSQAYVLFPFERTVEIIDTLTFTVTKTLTTAAPILSVAFNATGTQAYMASRTAPGSIQVLDMTTYKVMKSITVPDNPVDMIVIDDLLFVNSFDGASVSMIDLENFAVIQSIKFSGKPIGLIQSN